jgi:hypothetical protein
MVFNRTGGRIRQIFFCYFKQTPLREERKTFFSA